jgi:CrcB protein
VSPWGWAGLAVAGAIGAPLRYLVDGAVGDRVEGVFPWGTLLINATGSLLLGFLTGLGLYHAFSRTPRVVIGTGFVGAYTTFSTFTYETVRLVEEGAPAHAVANAVGTLVAGAVAAGAGLALAAL